MEEICRLGCGFDKECENVFPTNLPTNGLKWDKTAREKVTGKPMRREDLTAYRDTSGHGVKRALTF